MAVLELNGQNFAQEVGSAAGTVVVDFWAEWCGPCRMLSPIVDELAEELDGVKVMKCNTDQNPALAERFGIDAIPALLKFQNGALVGRQVGYAPKEQVRAFMQG